MIQAWTFRIFVLLFSVTAFLGWADGFSQYWKWRYDAAQTVAQPIVKNDGELLTVDKGEYALTFTTQTGQKIKLSRRLSAAQLEQLKKTRRIEVTYLVDSPQILRFDELPSWPSSWSLLFGFALLGLFWWTLRLKSPDEPSGQGMRETTWRGVTFRNWVLRVCFIVFPAVLFLSALNNYHESSKFAAQFRRATVLPITAYLDTKTTSKKLGFTIGESTSHSATLSFATEAGQLVSVNKRLDDMTLARLKAGQTVNIDYLPNQPTNTRLAGEERMVALPLLMGLVALVWAILFWRMTRPRLAVQESTDNF